MTLRDLWKIVDPHCYIYIAGSGYECRKLDALYGDITEIPEIKIVKVSVDFENSLYVIADNNKEAALSLLKYVYIYGEMPFSDYLNLERVIIENC